MHLALFLAASPQFGCGLARLTFAYIAGIGNMEEAASGYSGSESMLPFPIVS
jgi:hypothetical protein